MDRLMTSRVGDGVAVSDPASTAAVTARDPTARLPLLAASGGGAVPGGAHADLHASSAAALSERPPLGTSRDVSRPLDMSLEVPRPVDVFTDASARPAQSSADRMLTATPYEVAPRRSASPPLAAADPGGAAGAAMPTFPGPLQGPDLGPSVAQAAPAGQIAVGMARYTGGVGGRCAAEADGSGMQSGAQLPPQPQHCLQYSSHLLGPQPQRPAIVPTLWHQALLAQGLPHAAAAHTAVNAPMAAHRAGFAGACVYAASSPADPLRMAELATSTTATRPAVVWEGRFGPGLHDSLESNLTRQAARCGAAMSGSRRGGNIGDGAAMAAGGASLPFGPSLDEPSPRGAPLPPRRSARAPEPPPPPLPPLQLPGAGTPRSTQAGLGTSECAREELRQAAEPHSAAASAMPLPLRVAASPRLPAGAVCVGSAAGCGPVLAQTQALLSRVQAPLAPPSASSLPWSFACAPLPLPEARVDTCGALPSAVCAAATGDEEIASEINEINELLDIISGVDSLHHPHPSQPICAEPPTARLERANTSRGHAGLTGAGAAACPRGRLGSKGDWGNARHALATIGNGHLLPAGRAKRPEWCDR